MNEALMVKLGIEMSAYHEGLASAVAKAEAAGKKIAAGSLGANAAGRKAALEHAAANEELFRSERRVEHGIAGIAQSLTSMTSVSDVAAASVEGLHSVMKMPIGVGIGIAAAAVGYEKIVEGIKKAKEAHEANTKVLSAPTAVQAKTGSEDMRKDIEGVDEAGAKTKATLSDYTVVLADFYRFAVTGETVVGKLMEDQNKLTAKKFALSSAIAASIREEGNARDVLLHKSEREGELLKAQATMEAELARIKLDNSILPDARKAMTVEAKAKGANTAEAINEKFDGAQRSRDLESEILDIKRQGFDVDVKSGEARVRAAEAELAAAQTTEGKSGAEIKLTAERDALQAAKDQTTVRREQMGIQIAVANMQADAASKQMAELQLQSAELERQRRTATPDEAAHLDVAQAQNKSQQQSVLDAHSERMFSLADSMTAASAGSDRGSQIRALQGRASIASAHSEALQANPNASAEQIAAANDQAKKLTEQYESMVRENQELVRSSREELIIMEQALAGHDLIAQRLKVEKEYHDKILQAQKDGNTALAETLTKQSQIAQAQVTKDAGKAGKDPDHFVPDRTQTPQEQNAARLAWLKSKAQHGAEDRRNAHDKDNAGHVKGGPDHDVGNRSVAPHTEASGLHPGWLKTNDAKWPFPDHGHSTGKQYGPPAPFGKPHADIGGGGKGHLTKADMHDVMDQFVQKFVDGVKPLGEDC